MSKQITRVTLFKIPQEEDQKTLLGLYKQLPSKAVKDGKPYVRLLAAGAAKPDERAQGFTITSVSAFESLDDMAYYDNECAAHGEIKKFAKSVHQGYAMVYFENVASQS